MDADLTPTPPPSSSPGAPAPAPAPAPRAAGRPAGEPPFYLAHKMLTASVVALFGAMGAVMSLSLVSCNTLGGAGGKGGTSTTSGVNTPAAAPVTTKAEAETLAAVPAAALSNITSEPEMRIRLAGGIGEVELSGYLPSAGGKSTAGPVYLGPIGGQAGPMKLAGPLRVRMTTQGWLLTDGAGKSLRLEAPGELVVTADPADWTMGDIVPASEQKTGAPGPMVRVTPVAGAVGKTTSAEGAPYPGRIWLVPRSDLGAAFDVIEHVGLEKYLVGVVVKEMYQHWPKEAFKVQAICARTYALHERTRGQRTRRAFDVESTTRDQAYAGATTNRTAIEAVNATRGVVLSYQGELLRAYYSSTCGGRTASAADTWPITKGYEYNLLPPIQAHQRESLCQDSPIYVWTTIRTADDLTRRIRAFGEAQKQIVRQITGIRALEVMEMAPTGRPSVYKLVEPGGKWYRIKAEDLRVACNYAAPGLPAITSKGRVNSGDIVFKVTAPANSRLTGQQLAAATQVEVAGRGFGHGVGMCQYCARAMAARGDTWQQMLERFYDNAEIVKAYR